MTATLTEEQLRVIGVQLDEPARLIDPQSKRVYVLLDETVYERMRELLEGIQPQDAYAASGKVFAAGWNDPKMDVTTRGIKK